MNLWIVKQKGNALVQGWVDFEEVPPNGIVVKSIKAFVKRKYAKAYVDSVSGNDFLEIRKVSTERSADNGCT